MLLYACFFLIEPSCLLKLYCSSCLVSLFCMWGMFTYPEPNYKVENLRVSRDDK
jgi:hypothetical protein